MDPSERTATSRVTEGSREAPHSRGDTRENEVYRRLFEEGYRFDFFQAIRLLEQYAEDATAPGEVTDIREERVRLRPHEGLVFPAADVRRVSPPTADGTAAEVTSTFLGLYGIDSPLPYYLYEDLDSDEEDVLPLRDFLDIFNHRLYAFFYRAWRKHRPGIFGKPGRTDEHGRRALSIAGLPLSIASDAAKIDDLLAVAGHLASPIRNAQGLRRLLREVFDELPVRIIENIKRWVSLPYRPRMGRPENGNGLLLGRTTTIGERVLDVAGMFRIEIGPMSLEQFKSFLPREASARLLDEIVRLYAPDHLHYDVRLLLHADEIPSCSLGDGGVRLGMNSWLGQPESDVTGRVVTYASTHYL